MVAHLEVEGLQLHLAISRFRRNLMLRKSHRIRGSEGCANSPLWSEAARTRDHSNLTPNIVVLTVCMDADRRIRERYTYVVRLNAVLLFAFQVSHSQ